jgi:hypothetical protein
MSSCAPSGKEKFANFMTLGTTTPASADLGLNLDDEG